MSLFSLITVSISQFNVKQYDFSILALSAFLHDLKCKIRSWNGINEGFSPSFLRDNLLTP
jgi:hypothetical protein